jgi:hypothetical protein
MQNVKVTHKGEKGAVPARVFMIFARHSPNAVIFRRGPSDWVQIIKWNTQADTFDFGQWFHGRIYERRSDLSPDGSLLIYFARKITGRTLKDNEYTYAWTAVSRPPFLTALALWPKGDCWHGGGLFKNARTVELNHRPNVAKAHPKHNPKGLKVILKKNVHGEDDPIFSERLERDGWALQQEWIVKNTPTLFKTLQPEIREKLSPDGKLLIVLTRSIERLDYSEEFAISDNRRSFVIGLEGASWADWDQQGRLVFARDGKVFSGSIADQELTERELIDFNPSKPGSVVSPEWATKW